MANYFVLKCVAGGGPLHFALTVNPSARKYWKMGRVFSGSDEDADFRPPEGTVEIETKIDSKVKERVYPELTWHPIPLMTRRLVTALQSAGVTNLQLYETTLVNPQGNPPPPDDLYLAVNVVGAVEAANLEESETSPEVSERLISADFTSLAIDETKARDLLMFRLAENVSAGTRARTGEERCRGTGHHDTDVVRTRIVGGIGSILRNLAALDYNVTGGLDIDLAASVESDVLALNRNRPVLLHGDAGGTCLIVI